MNKIMYAPMHVHALIYFMRNMYILVIFLSLIYVVKHRSSEKKKSLPFYIITLPILYKYNDSLK